ncbi:hypothetical protein ACHAWF_017376 [Thalassiosira exigua]
MESTLLVPLRTPCVYRDPSFLSSSEATEAYETLSKETPWTKTAKINRWVTLMELPRDEGVGGGGGAGEEGEEGGGGEEGEEGGDGGGGEDGVGDGADEGEGERKSQGVGDDGGEGKEGRNYRYRDAPGTSLIGPFPPVVAKLQSLAEEWILAHSDRTVTFDVCLLNYYDSGSQRIGWHSDREEIGRSTPIASVSLGATRKFLIRSKSDGTRDRATVEMTNGSLIVMENVCQRDYLHSVPRESEVMEGRINLTFRCKGGTENGGGGTTQGELEHERRDHWISKIQTEEGVADSTAGAWKQEGAAGIDNRRGAAATGGGTVFGDDARFHDPSELSDEELAESAVYAVKTNVGAECYCAAEIEEVLDAKRYEVLARPFGVAGYVAVRRRVGGSTDDEGGDPPPGEVAEAEAEASLLRLRTAHHALRYHDRFDLEDVLPRATAEGGSEDDDGGQKETRIRAITGEMLYEHYKAKLVAKEASAPSLAKLEVGGTFRVTCERIGGNHGFRAPEVERCVVFAGGGGGVAFFAVAPVSTDQLGRILVATIGRGARGLSRGGPRHGRIHGTSVGDSTRRAEGAGGLRRASTRTEPDGASTRRAKAPEDRIDRLVGCGKTFLQRRASLSLTVFSSTQRNRRRHVGILPPRQAQDGRLRRPNPSRRRVHESDRRDADQRGRSVEAAALPPLSQLRDYKIELGVRDGAVRERPRGGRGRRRECCRVELRGVASFSSDFALSRSRALIESLRDIRTQPFCGSGTILLEALDCYDKIKCVGMDVSRRSAEGARENARAEGAEDRATFVCCDARNFRKHLEEESVDAIVTNLPWGIMTGHKNVSDLQSMYEVFLRTAWYVLKDGARVVMLVLRGLQLTRIVRKLSGRYRLLSVNCVRTTNNLPSIVVVEKLAVDEVRSAVKRRVTRGWGPSDYLVHDARNSSHFVVLRPAPGSSDISPNSSTSARNCTKVAVHYEKIDEKTL